MGLLNRAGRFIATINDFGISDTGKPPKCTAIIQYGIDQEFRDGKWADVSGEGASITGYFYLETNTGDLNEFTIKTLKESLAWNGRDIERLTEAKGCQVQITTEVEAWEGKSRAKVKFMNNGNWDGQGSVTHDPAAVKRAQQRLGSKLKAVSGGTPAPAVKAPDPVDEPAPWDAQQGTIYDGDVVWSLFQEKYGNLKGGAQTSAWDSFVKRIAPNVKDDSELTTEDWAKVAHEIQTSRAAVV